MQVYLNTGFIPESRATVSVHDLGFLYGDGVFETFRAYNGTLFRVDDHLDRLEESARRIRLKLPYRRERLRRVLSQTLTRNGLKEALLRLTVSRGIGPWGSDRDFGARPTLVVMARRFTGYPEKVYREGQKILIATVRKHSRDCLDPRIKSLNFLNHRLARGEARRRGFDEAVLLNSQGDLAEGSVSNLFLVREGRLLTPSEDSGILLGVTRQIVFEIARRLRVPVREARLPRKELKRAEECFLTNTSMEIMPVHHVDRLRIGNGKPGEVTKGLREEFKKLVQRECGR
jgi:branched-chain amino acid aminotransferase